jgi:hypothetical protein
LIKERVLFDLEDKMAEEIVITGDDFNFRDIEIEKSGKVVKEEISRCIIVHFEYK